MDAGRGRIARCQVPGNRSDPVPERAYRWPSLLAWPRELSRDLRGGRPPSPGAFAQPRVTVRERDELSAFKLAGALDITPKARPGAGGPDRDDGS